MEIPQGALTGARYVRWTIVSNCMRSMMGGSFEGGHEVSKAFWLLITFRPKDEIHRWEAAVFSKKGTKCTDKKYAWSPCPKVLGEVMFALEPI